MNTNMISIFIVTFLTQITSASATDNITEGWYMKSDMACISCDSPFTSTTKVHCAIQCLKEGDMCEAFAYTASQCSMCIVTSILTGSTAHAYFERIPLDTGLYTSLSQSRIPRFVCTVKATLRNALTISRRLYDS